jgi:MtN3 and saliva related transmembrane protein
VGAIQPQVVVGVLAALCSIGSFLPQAIKIWRERDASAVSLQMYLVTAAGFALWIAYGVLLKSWPLIASNAASLAVSSSILGLKVRFSGKGEGG